MALFSGWVAHMNIDKNAVLRLRICGRAAFTICVSCDASAATVASATSARNAGRTCGVGSSMRLTVANSKANGGSHNLPWQIKVSRRSLRRYLRSRRPCASARSAVAAASGLIHSRPFPGNSGAAAFKKYVFT
jgi:hypothetical protein